MKYLKLLPFFALLFIVPSCGDDDTPKPTTCDTENITYTNFVGDVLNESCTFSGCHVTSNTTTIGSLSTYDEASNFINEAVMIAALRREADRKPMPRDTATGMATENPLPDCTIDKIEAWLAAGKPK